MTSGNQEIEALVATARRFANDTLAPFAALADKAEPENVDTTEVLREASRLGLRTFTLPREYGGLDANCETEVRVLEEIARGDAGFAMTLAHCWREGAALVKFGTTSARERLLPEFVEDDGYLTSWALTEPHSGSDHSTQFAGTLDAGPATSAVQAGDEWVINGEKCFITNAPSSRLIFVFARTDATVPWTDGTSAFLVHRDTPGLSWSDLEDKLGLRVNQNARLRFRDVRVPADHLVGAVNRGVDFLHAAGAGSKAREAIRSVGVARAALDAAISCAGSRLQGGKTIAHHQAIQVEIADMAMEVEAARALTLNAAKAVDGHLPEAAALENMAKVVASEMGARVATKALQVFGHRGLLRENPVEKLVRDAVALLPPPVGNHALRARVGAQLLGVPE